jgi:hypothetical protein
MPTKRLMQFEDLKLKFGAGAVEDDTETPAKRLMQFGDLKLKFGAGAVDDATEPAKRLMQFDDLKLKFGAGVADDSTETPAKRLMQFEDLRLGFGAADDATETQAKRLMQFDDLKLKFGAGSVEDAPDMPAKRLMQFDDLRLGFGAADDDNTDALAKRLMDIEDIRLGGAVPESMDIKSGAVGILASEALAKGKRSVAKGLTKIRFGLGGAGQAVTKRAELTKTALGPNPGMIVGIVLGAIVFLILAYLVISPLFDRRRAKAQMAASKDVESGPKRDANGEISFQRSGPNLAPIQPQQMTEARRPSQDFHAVSLVTPVNPTAQGQNPFRSPPHSPTPKPVAEEKMSEKTSEKEKEMHGDPFTDEVAAMQERLKGKFQAAHERFKS